VIRGCVDRPKAGVGGPCIYIYFLSLLNKGDRLYTGYDYSSYRQIEPFNHNLCSANT
jgi:hypothetical protein